MFYAHMYLGPFLTVLAFTYNNETKAGISPSSCSAHIILHIAIHNSYTVKDFVVGSRRTFSFYRTSDLDRRDKGCRINNAIRTLNHVAFQPELNRELSIEL